MISPRFFLILDAAGLATFGVAGILVSLVVGSPWPVASFMGVMTDTMGGIFRDVLCNETPVVFGSPLYATVSWVGSLLFELVYLQVDVTLSALIAGLCIFLARLLVLYYNVSLPRFRFKR